MNYTCPVCDYKLLENPPKNYEICPICNTEFGYDDFTKTHEQLRQQWEIRKARRHKEWDIKKMIYDLELLSGEILLKLSSEVKTEVASRLDLIVGIYNRYKKFDGYDYEIYSVVPPNIWIRVYEDVSKSRRLDTICMPLSLLDPSDSVEHIEEFFKSKFKDDIEKELKRQEDTKNKQRDDELKQLAYLKAKYPE